MQNDRTAKLDDFPHGRNLRKGRFSGPGRIYLITTVTRDRRAEFADFSAARSVIQVLINHDRLGFAKTLSFVVMPDHLHWLMQLGDIKNLGETVQALKSLTARRLGRTLFQKGFYDRALRQEDDIKGLARYIVASPLRAGLVNHINDYPHWDAIWL